MTCEFCGDVGTWYGKGHGHSKLDVFWCQWGNHHVGRRPKYRRSRKEGGIPLTMCLGCKVMSLTFYIGTAEDKAKFYGLEKGVGN